MPLTDQQREDARKRLRRLAGGSTMGMWPDASLDAVIDAACKDLLGEVERWRELGGDLVRGAMLAALSKETP